MLGAQFYIAVTGTYNYAERKAAKSFNILI